MSADQAAELDPLTRVVFLIPRLENAEADGLFNEVITEIRRDFGGVTWSQDHRPVFRGWWIDPVTHELSRNDNILIFFDVDPSKTSRAKLLTYLAALKQRLQNGLGEKLIWMTIYPAERITAFDQLD